MPSAKYCVFGLAVLPLKGFSRGNVTKIVEKLFS